MNFEQLVQYVKDNGCKVIVYKNRGSLKGDQCAGYFEHNKKGPYICMAVVDLEESSRSELLLHEFSHYMQWKDGTETKDIDDCYDLWDKWLRGKKELDAAELERIRRVILTHEWDAEMRAVRLGKNLHVEGYKPRDIICGANAYMATIKWSFQTRKTSSWTASRDSFKPKILTKKELLAPLDKRQLKKVATLIGLANYAVSLPKLP